VAEVPVTPPELHALVRRTWLALGWPWWSAPHDLNVFGVRAPSDVPDRWDDVIGVAYTDAAGAPHVERWVATTDPGRHYLLSPLHPLGTLLVEPGYHRGLWAPGLHTGYPALVQVGELAYRRDADRDDVLDPPGPVVKGTGNGVNLHHGGAAALVGRYSAGCQVVRMPAALTRILELVELQRRAGHGVSVSYGLVDVRQRPECAPLLGLGA
jgi:hypothetical protein